MNRKLKILNAGLIVALFASAAALAAETNAPAEKPADKIAELFGDPVVAKGTGVEIKRSDLDAAVMGLKAAGMARGQQYTPDQSTALEVNVLNRLIQIQLLLNRASEADKAKGKEETDKRYEIILKRAGSDEALARQLKSVGMTSDELRRKMTEESTAEAVVVRELKVEVSDADAKKYYEDFPARFEQPEKVRASHILIGTMDPTTHAPLSDEKKLAKRKVAEELLKRARAGEDFTTLVKEYSDDPSARETGGVINFARGTRGIPPEFETAAFALSTNGISDIVTSQMGFHIIKLNEKIPARKLTLDETVEGVKIMDQVKDVLKRQQLEKLLPDYIEKLTTDAKVEVLDKKLKEAEELMKQAAESSKTDSLLDTKPDEKK